MRKMPYWVWLFGTVAIGLVFIWLGVIVVSDKSLLWAVLLSGVLIWFSWFLGAIHWVETSEI